MKSSVSFESCASAVWLAVTGLAFILPMIVSVHPVGIGAALAEVVLLGPLAALLASMAARAMADGRWVVRRGAGRQAEPFYVNLAVVILLSACFLAAFVRGFVSLALYL